MRGGWQFVTGFVASVVLGFAGSGSSDAVFLFPPEAAALLPYAVVLRQVEVLEAPGAKGLVFFGFHDFNGDRLLDLAVGGDRRVEVMFGRGQGRFSPGPWVYLEVEEHSEGRGIPGRTVLEASTMRWRPYEVEQREGKAYVPMGGYKWRPACWWT